MSPRLVIDTSVYIAILAGEPDADALVEIIRRHEQRFVSAASYVECAIVSGRWLAGRTDLASWLSRERIEIVSIDQALAQHAADAFFQFGKGCHPAGLNFGDCFSSALAKSLNAPLLFKGDDFAGTDIVSALA